MIKELWINLPVKDLTRSKAFFSNIGFPVNPGPGNSDHSASFLIGNKNVVLMLFPESTFKDFTSNEIADTRQVTEVLFSIDVDTRSDVDEIADKAEKAGGSIFSKPSDVQGWMYGCGFADLDGHRWNILYMDMSKLPK